jgi:hypothetical protein
MQINNCKNCKEPITGNYCSNCGQPAKLKRVDRHYIIHEIGDVFGANKGFFYTLKRMLTNPGESVRHFIIEERYRFFKPVSFVFLTSLIYSFICHFFQIRAEDFYLQQPDMEFPTVTLFINWMTDYQGYTAIMSGFFMAFWIKLFFRKSGYNIFEVFILLCFLAGVSSLFSSIVVIVQGYTYIKLIHISILPLMIYHIWATAQFFDKKKAINYLKAFLSYILGYWVFGFLVACIAIFIDIVIRK